MKKTAIITGASRGIGKACALLLADYFDCIVINSFHNETALNETRDFILQKGTQCLAFCGDVGDFDFVSHMMTQILKSCPPVDLLVNNAGISHIGLLSDLSITQWNQIINTNLTSVFNCCNQIIPHMVHNQSGHIINISSMWGLSGASCEVAYSASKGGMNAFTQALAKELAPSKVCVNALACGTIDTEMNQQLSDEDRENLCNDIPACRFGTPQEVAQAVLHLYQSPSYLTGEIIKIDGGYL